MIQLTRHGSVISVSDKKLASLKRQFSKDHWVSLPQFLEPSLLDFVKRSVSKAKFKPVTHQKKVGAELSMLENDISGLFEFIMNDARLFEIVRRITGCRPIGCFTGRMYQMLPNQNHYLAWHNDMLQDRLVAVSINLSSKSFEGGILQIREEKSGEIVSEISNKEFGQGVLFRISPKLEHRLTQLEGTAVRITYAGWFRSKPDYRLAFKKRLRAIRNQKESNRAVSLFS